MPISSYTLINLVRRLAREMGAIKAEGTSASVTTTTIVDTVNMQFPTDSDFNGFETVIVSGGGVTAGSTRIITGSTTATKTITIPTLTGLTGTPVYMVLDPSIGYYQNFVDAIRSAIEEVVNHAMPHKRDMTLRVNDMTMGQGSFENWATNGATGPPDGWAITNLTGAGATMARNADATHVDAPHSGADISQQYSVLCATASGNTASFRWSPSFTRTFDLQNVGVYAIARVQGDGSVNASRLSVTDGQSTQYSAYVDSSATYTHFQELQTGNLTVASNASTFYGSLEHSVAAANTYMDNFRLISAQPIFSYVLPGGFTAISDIYIEGSIPFTWEYRLPDHLWDIWLTGGTNDRLDFVPFAPLVADRRIMLVGQAAPTIPSAATDNIDINPEYVLSFAKAQLYRRLKDFLTADRWEAKAKEERDMLTFGLRPNSKVLKPL